MRDLKTLVTEYLKASDYNVTQSADLVVADRPALGEGHDSSVIWIQETTPDSVDKVLESRVLAEMQKIARKYQRASLVYLTYTREGLSRDFISASRDTGFNIRVPTEFFDAPFRNEVAKDATNAARELAKEAETFRPKRISQPFRVIYPNGEQKEGEDIVSELTSALRQNTGKPSIRFLLGPAGSGKSIAFNELYAEMYRHFIDQKKRQLLGAKRPIPLLPEHLRAAVGTRVNAIIESFLRTDVATPLRREALTWLVDNEFMCLMMDGLDEVLIRDSEFFEYLIDRITTPNAAPQVIICVRESLLSSCPLLTEFVEDAHEWVERYELLKWAEPAKRSYAAVRFPGDTTRQNGFIKASQTPQLRELSSLPFYCNLLADQYEQGDLTESIDELGILGKAVSGICKREYTKQLLDPNLVPEPVLQELIEEAASIYFGSRLSEIPLTELREIIEIILPDKLDEYRKEELTTRLSQFAMFRRTAQTGAIAFTHEILAYYLLSNHLGNKLTRNCDAFVRDMGLLDCHPHEPLLHLISTQIAKAGNTERIRQLLLAGVTSPIAFKNILQLHVNELRSNSQMQELQQQLLARDLSEMVFRKLKLDGMNFRQCNLTGANFVQCSLRECAFEGAIIKNTGFSLLSPEDLKAATFGLYETVFSLSTGTKMLGDPRAAVKWLQERTATPPPIKEPCPTADQLRHLLGKFVHPTGESRRFHLDVRGVLAGKRYAGAPSTEDVLKNAVSLGYMVEDTYRNRISRPEGAKYGEIVDYVSRFRLSNGLAQLLDRLCDIKDCPHVPAPKPTS